MTIFERQDDQGRWWILGLYPEAAIPEHRAPRGKLLAAARPAHIRVTGPITGHWNVTEPDELRREAKRLLEAADALADEQARLF